MGGGTIHIDLPLIHIRPSSSSNGENKSSKNLGVSSSHLPPMKPSCADSNCFCGGETCTKLEVVNGREDKRAIRSSFTSGFGPVPSQSEVQNAIAALLNFMNGSDQPEKQRLHQQILNSCVPMLSYGQRRVYDAFQMLQTDPCIKRLVVSLSSDKALWDAITNNELVRKLREPLFSELPPSSNTESELGARIMRWIMEITKAKVMELIEQFQSVVDAMFLSPETLREKNPTPDDKDEFEEKLRSSLLLSIVILLIVVVTRFRGT